MTPKEDQQPMTTREELVASDGLRVCPWCGSQPKIEVIDDDWCIYCDKRECPVEPFTFDPDKSEAIIKWNVRPGEAVTGGNRVQG